MILISLTCVDISVIVAVISPVASMPAPATEFEEAGASSPIAIPSANAVPAHA